MNGTYLEQIAQILQGYPFCVLNLVLMQLFVLADLVDNGQVCEPTIEHSLGQAPASPNVAKRVQ